MIFVDIDAFVQFGKATGILETPAAAVISAQLWLPAVVESLCKRVAKLSPRDRQMPRHLVDCLRKALADLKHTDARTRKVFASLLARLSGPRVSCGTNAPVGVLETNSCASSLAHPRVSARARAQALAQPPRARASESKPVQLESLAPLSRGRVHVHTPGTRATHGMGARPWVHRGAPS